MKWESSRDTWTRNFVKMSSQRTMFEYVGCFPFWMVPHETRFAYFKINCFMRFIEFSNNVSLSFFAWFLSIHRHAILAPAGRTTMGNDDAAFVRTAITYIRSSRISVISMIVQLLLNRKLFRCGHILSIIKFPTNARVEPAQQKRFLACGKCRWTHISLRATRAAIAHI